MREPSPCAQHTVKLSIGEEMRFMHAIIIWEGHVFGSVNDAIREAIRDWIVKIEAGTKKKNQK